MKNSVPFEFYLKVFFSRLISFLMYPRKVIKRYRAYNSGIGEMILQLRKTMQSTEYLENHRARNSKLVNFFVLLPFFAGLSFSSYEIYSKRDLFSRYVNEVTKPIEKTVYGKRKKYIPYIKDKAVFMYRQNPFNMEILIPFLIGYGFCFIGAGLLMKNPAFKKESDIQVVFTALRHTDLEGNPWKVVWTPNAILIEAFGEDPSDFCVNKKGKKLWNAIKFSPGEPMIFNDNPNKFVVQRRYDLPSELIFNQKDLF